MPPSPDRARSLAPISVQEHGRAPRPLLLRLVGRKRRAPPAIEDPPASERPSALLVEDDEDMLEFLSSLMEEDYELLKAHTAEEALEVARDRLPDVILLDILLPGMNGIDCLHALRKGATTAEIPVVILSAQRSEETRVLSIESGAADYIAKPFLGGELLARVGKAIRAARERKALWRLATTDPLTGMANFRSLHERLEGEVDRARRYKHPLAIIMADMDNLKEINDTLGHDTGNRAIQRMAEAIRSTLRHTDFAARFGGDEFVILLPHSGLKEGEQLAERLRNTIRDMRMDGLSLRASFGVSAVEVGEDADGQELLSQADHALYEAKRMGRDRVQISRREVTR